MFTEAVADALLDGIKLLPFLFFDLCCDGIYGT